MTAKYGHAKAKELPCKDCGIKVKVGDDAVGVVCSNCTLKRQLNYEASIKRASEGTDDRQKNPVQDDSGRSDIPEGRGKVRGSKRSDKPAVKGAEKAAGGDTPRPRRKAQRSGRKQ